MRREWGFWLVVYGLLFGILGICLLVVALAESGIPTALSLSAGVAAMAGYIISVWRAFLRR